MAKHTEIEGYSVTAFVGVTRDRTPQMAEEIATRIKADMQSWLQRNWRSMAEHSTEIEPQIAATCEHCHYIWTEKSETYNGGCCAADETAEEQRKIDNGQFGVGA